MLALHRDQNGSRLEVPDARSMIVVPCYDEGFRLLVDEFERFLCYSQVSFVLVDDCSRESE